MKCYILHFSPKRISEITHRLANADGTLAGERSGLVGSADKRVLEESLTHPTDVCRWTAKHQRNIYVGAWQSTGGISEQLINLSSLGLMLIHLCKCVINSQAQFNNKIHVRQFGCVAQ